MVRPWVHLAVIPKKLGRQSVFCALKGIDHINGFKHLHCRMFVIPAMSRAMFRSAKRESLRRTWAMVYVGNSGGTSTVSIGCTTPLLQIMSLFPVITLDALFSSNV